MSNLWFNIRFGTYHFQCGPNTFRLYYNTAHSKEERINIPNWKWFQVYEWFGKSSI